RVLAVGGGDVDAGAVGRHRRVAADVPVAEGQPVEDQAGPHLAAVDVLQVDALGEPHRSFRAQVGEDGDDVVGDVDDLLQPAGQVLLQEAGDELVDQVLQPAGQARDGELAEQRLVQQADGLEDVLDRLGQRLADAVGVLGQPDAGDVGRAGAVGHAGAAPAS